MDSVLLSLVYTPTHHMPSTWHGTHKVYQALKMIDGIKSNKFKDYVLAYCYVEESHELWSRS